MEKVQTFTAVEWLVHLELVKTKSEAEKLVKKGKVHINGFLATVTDRYPNPKRIRMKG